MDIFPDLDRSACQDTRSLAYDPAAAHQLWQVLSQVDLALKAFRATLRQETSPVQLWPHHFDLAMLWFSGRPVPDQDRDQEKWADEQMNYGFSTGDAGIPEPYFYATAYPSPAGLTEAQLPASRRPRRPARHPPPNHPIPDTARAPRPRPRRGGGTRPPGLRPHRWRGRAP